MDASASDVDWQVTAHTRDGAPVPAPPLSPADVAELGDLRDTVRFAVSYRLQEVVTAEVAPEAFVERHSKRVSTTMPAGMPWRSAAYLAKVERSLRSIGAVRGEPVDPDYRVTLKWWLNAGAVGGHGGFTMPLHHMVADFDWYTHPWAISHELLHGLGYGHGADMDRTDHLVQERFDRYRWFVADHPDLVPEALRE